MNDLRMTLDDVDTRLLTALQNDTYLTAQELGGTLNFSVLNRLLHQVLPGHPGVAFPERRERGSNSHARVGRPPSRRLPSPAVGWSLHACVRRAGLEPARP